MEPLLNEPKTRILITPERPATHNDLGATTRSNSNNPPPKVLSASRNPTASEKPHEIASEASFWGSDGFTFADLIDFINPLQHIPVVSTIYRAITGDEIGSGPRIFGGAILGGVIGAGIALANTAVVAETGKDIGENVLASAMEIGNKAMDFAGLGGAPTVANKMMASAATVDANGIPKPAILASSVPFMQALPDIMNIPEATLPIPEEEIIAAAQGLAIPQGADGTIDPVVMRLLGSGNAAHEQYRQIQSMDALQKTALNMDVDA